MQSSKITFIVNYLMILKGAKHTMVSAIKRKVNRIGIVGQVASIILIVMMAVAVTALVTCAVLFVFIPKDSIQVSFSTDFDLKVTDKLIGPFMDDFTQEDLDTVNADLSVNGREFNELSFEKQADGVVMKGATDRIQLEFSRIIYALVAALIYCATLLVIFIFLKRLSDAFRRCDSPFSDEVVSRMTTFAWVLLIGSVVSSVAQSVANSIISRSTELSFSLNPSGLHSGYTFSFSFTPILIALVVLFLVMIFRYGAQLQKEADETL